MCVEFISQPSTLNYDNVKSKTQMSYNSRFILMATDFSSNQISDLFVIYFIQGR